MRAIFLSLLGVSLLNVSCGVASQVGSSKLFETPSGENSAVSGSAQLTDEVGLQEQVQSSYTEAIWFVPCDATDRVPVAAPGQIVIAGRSFNSVRENFAGTKIIFEGRVCPPKNLPRDVVFLIDVSASMGYRDGDPVVGGTCKRQTQLEAMIAGLPAGSNFGVVTYEETIGAASSNLFTTKAELYADLTGNGSIPITNIVCGWTNQGFLDVGMSQANLLLAMGRGVDVQKDLVLMTDGDNTVSPANTHLMAGLQMASDLRTVGVVVGGATPLKVKIAGLRVASVQVDKYLARLASVDLSNVSMVDDIMLSPRMNTRLNALSLGVLSTSKISFGPVGAANSTTIDVKAIIAADYSFRVNAGYLNLARDQVGYNLRLDSVDTRGSQTIVTGLLNWVQP